MTPLKAIRTYCLHCMGGHQQSAQYVRECDETICPLHDWRMGRKPADHKPALSALKAIRKKCLGCVETAADVRRCTGKPADGDCVLNQYRFGKNPSLKGRGASPEVMARVRGALAGKKTPSQTAKFSKNPGRNRPQKKTHTQTPPKTKPAREKGFRKKEAA